MFDNLGTALVQAIGFFGVFGFFVYQLLSDGKKTTKNISRLPQKKVNKKINDLNKKTNKTDKKLKNKKPLKKNTIARNNPLKIKYFNLLLPSKNFNRKYIDII